MNARGARRPGRALTIFVPHASELLTDHEARGDGLVAYEIVVRLAERGHRLHVMAPRIDVRAALPPNLIMYEAGAHPGRFVPRRLAYMLAVRRMYERIRRRESIDLVHQLNPVVTGISLALGGTRAPRICGSFVPAQETARVPTVLFLGRLEQCKGIFSLISAFRLVRAALPDAVLVVAGCGSEWHRMDDAVKNAGLSDCVRFIGAVSREAAPRVISESSVLCLPSCGEPVGMVVLAATASADPAVATRARKLAPASPADLADALVEILKSPSPQHGIGRHNRAVAEQRYNWPTIIDWLESVYADVIERSS